MPSLSPQVGSTAEINLPDADSRDQEYCVYRFRVGETMLRSRDTGYKGPRPITSVYGVKVTEQQKALISSIL